MSDCKWTTERERLQAELSRGDHVIFLVVDAIVAVHLAFRRWMDRRRTRRILARLDDRQLHDIGLTRGDVYVHAVAWRRARDKCNRALVVLEDDKLVDLSEAGRQIRKEARRTHSLG